MGGHLDIRRDGHVLTIRFARPEKRNALTLDMYGALADALIDAEAGFDTRAIALLGSGGSFTAGNDISDFLRSSPEGLAEPVLRWLRALADSTVPIVAGVDGDAVGIGTTMLLHCDIVLVTARARLRMPFVDLALVPEAGSSWLLPKAMGHARAAELLLLADAFDGEQAAKLGIATRVVPPNDVERDTLDIARRLAAKPPRAVRETKRLMKADRDMVRAAIDAEAAVFARCLASPEAREAFSAFTEKRAPDFSKLA